MSVEIVLATVNARYYHASLGLRYLLANLGELRERTALLEFTLETPPAEAAERILSHRPRVVGLGVYVWNVEQVDALAALLRTVDPSLTIVMGGPEMADHEDLPGVAAHADYVISGQADRAFAGLCGALLAGSPPPRRLIAAPVPDLATVELPYSCYDDEDIANRLIYVEASRGCPFKCGFCLSSLDRTAWRFEPARFVGALDDLYRRGVRHFKFVDRTFNLRQADSTRILDYFLELQDASLFLHFELIPDRLPDSIRERLTRFPPGTVQLEIGIQSFNAEVQRVIDRRQDDAATVANLSWLRQNTGAHLHADLIFGLPGEDLDSFAAGFNRLWSLGPHEIQLGILKRLRGTPLVRLQEQYDLRFNPKPPYELLSSDRVDFATVRRVQRMARYWDMIANSGRFSRALGLLPGARMFESFLDLADWLYDATGQTHRIALPRLFELVCQGLVEAVKLDRGVVVDTLGADYRAGGYTGTPAFAAAPPSPRKPAARHSSRQARHAGSR